jgi:hypothetical protein
MVHFLAGIVLVGLGPIQLVPWIRQNYLHLQRSTGRVYIGAALLAASCATLFVILYGTSRGDLYAGNILFGTLVITVPVSPTAMLPSPRQMNSQVVVLATLCSSVWSSVVPSLDGG